MADPPIIGGVPPRFSDRTFVLAGEGDSGYPPREEIVRLIETEGGRVISTVTPALDYLIVCPTRRRRPTAEQKQAERLNRSGQAHIQIVQQHAFHDAFPLGREESLALLHAGVEGIKRWARLRGESRSPLDLHGLVLPGADLSGLCLYGVNLDRADLRDANLEGTILDRMADAQLDGECLVRGRVTGFTNCSLRKANLRSANLNPAVLQRCDFTGAALGGATLACTVMADVRFSGADLSRAGLDGSKLAGVDFTRANLEESYLRGCDLTGAGFCRANLHKTDLSKSNLARADLSGADLRAAQLLDADLTGATIDGADFTGANLVGMKTANLDAAKAKGLDLSRAIPAGQTGPHVRELENAARQARRLQIGATIDHKDGPICLVVTYYGSYQHVNASASGQCAGYYSPARTVCDAMLDLAHRYSGGVLRIDSVTASSRKSPVGGKALQRLALAAWCEVCGVLIPSESDLRERVRERKAREAERREPMLAELRGGAAGVARWNARTREERQKAGPFRRVDLSGCDLAGVDLRWLDFQGAVFDGASLFEAKLGDCDLRKASFQRARLTSAWGGGAKLSGADFTEALLCYARLNNCTFHGANFQAAQLRGAFFVHADLRGADLSGTDLDGAYFKDTRFNERTRLPPGLRAQEGVVGKVRVPSPTTALPTSTAPADANSFDDLMRRLPHIVDADRLSNALRMLKAQRFQLYAEVQSDGVVGVVKSQTDRELVYSCRLGADGAFSCCTQNLRHCGGLHGKLCKHLLVLLVGLAKAGQLDPATAEQWAQASRSQRPTLDKDAMSETFLRYKGAEAGEIDWRPTETIPEDYYAL